MSLEPDGDALWIRNEGLAVPVWPLDPTREVEPDYTEQSSICVEEFGCRVTGAHAEIVRHFTDLKCIDELRDGFGIVNQWTGFTSNYGHVLLSCVIEDVLFAIHGVDEVAAAGKTNCLHMSEGLRESSWV